MNQDLTIETGLQSNLEVQNNANILKVDFSLSGVSLEYRPMATRVISTIKWNKLGFSSIKTIKPLPPPVHDA